MKSTRKASLQLILIPVILGSFVLLTAGGPADDEQGMASQPKYVIYPGDILEILVWREPDLSRKVLVRPDGRISVPLLQDLRAAGSTPGQLRQEIEAGLQEYLDAPNVTVIVDSILHYKVYVTGKVQAPGGFTADQEITALQALTLAGGFQEYAKESEITIVRTGRGTPQTFDFNYNDVIKGKRSEQNIYLQSGDVVVVP